MPSVNSSAITEIDWDEQSEDLTVRMRDGTVLVYLDVPQGVYEDFLSAGSVGAFFNAEIRNSYSVR